MALGPWWIDPPPQNPSKKSKIYAPRSGSRCWFCVFGFHCRSIRFSNRSMQNTVQPHPRFGRLGFMITIIDLLDLFLFTRLWSLLRRWARKAGGRSLPITLLLTPQRSCRAVSSPWSVVGWPPVRPFPTLEGKGQTCGPLPRGAWARMSVRSAGRQMRG